MLDLNMFSLRVLNKIFRDINGTDIITIYDEMFLTNTIIKKKFLHPKELSIKTSSSNVFYLSSWEIYGILLLTHPWNKIISQIETPTKSTLMIISITSTVSIRIIGQNVFCVLIIPNTRVTSWFNVFDNMLYCSNVRFFRISLIFSTHSYTVANVRSTCSKVKKATYQHFFLTSQQWVSHLGS